MKPQPNTPPKCPQCGQQLSYRKTGTAWRRRIQKAATIETANEVLLYHCATHGFFARWPDGRWGYVLNSLDQTDPDDFDDPDQPQ